MDYIDITYDNRGWATWITLNRPDRRNAVRPRTNEELIHAFRRADQDPDTRFVVLTGAGPGFCAGDDFQEIFLAEDREGRESQRRLDRYKHPERAHNPTIGDILRCEKPTIAAVNGAAVGMGFDYALACDIRIAADTASFGSYFIRRGVLGTFASYYLLPRIVGLSRGLEMALSGELVDAATAERIGLVSRVVPADELTASVEETLEKLSWGAPLAQRAAKRAMIRGLTMDWQGFDEYLAPLSDGLWATEDHREGVQSFIERRPPRFEGR